MRAVGVVDASCEEIFELVMSMDITRFEWDCSFQYGSLVEEVDGHTAILYHRLQQDWFPMCVWPRDLCYVRYWRRNEDGSYGGGFNISPLKPQNGRPRTQVQHLMQIDLKGWGVGYISSFQQHCLLQMLNNVAGISEYFSQTNERSAHPRILVMVNMASTPMSSKKSQKLHNRSTSLEQINAANKNGMMMDEYSDEDDEFQIPDPEACSMCLESDVKKTALEEECTNQIDLSCFLGNLQRDDRDNGRDCWRISDGNNFRVCGNNFYHDKSKISAGKHLMELVAVDWFKDTKRMDHVARRHGCAAQVASEKGFFSIVVNLQVPGSTHYNIIFYFVMKELVPGSLLQRFVDGDDEFRYSRLKIIPSVPNVCRSF